MAGCEALLTDESGRLVTQAAGDFGALQGGASQATVSLRVRGADNLREQDLLAVQTEPVNQFVVVLKGLEVQEHSAAGIGGVGDVNVAVGAAIELVSQPSIDRAKGKIARFVGLLYSVDIFKQPEQLTS